MAAISDNVNNELFHFSRTFIESLCCIHQERPVQLFSRICFMKQQACLRQTITDLAKRRVTVRDTAALLLLQNILMYNK